MHKVGEILKLDVLAAAGFHDYWSCNCVHVEIIELNPQQRILRAKCTGCGHIACASERAMQRLGIGLDMIPEVDGVI